MQSWMMVCLVLFLSNMRTVTRFSHSLLQPNMPTTQLRYLSCKGLNSVSSHLSLTQLNTVAIVVFSAITTLCNFNENEVITNAHFIAINKSIEALFEVHMNRHQTPMQLIYPAIFSRHGCFAPHWRQNLSVSWQF
jgi:hypothetical protein